MFKVCFVFLVPKKSHPLVSSMLLTQANAYMHVVKHTCVYTHMGGEISLLNYLLFILHFIFWHDNLYIVATCRHIDFISRTKNNFSGVRKPYTKEIRLIYQDDFCHIAAHSWTQSSHHSYLIKKLFTRRNFLN